MIDPKETITVPLMIEGEWLTEMLCSLIFLANLCYDYGFPITDENRRKFSIAFPYILEIADAITREVLKIGHREEKSAASGCAAGE